MSKIRIDLEAALIDGQALTFKSPADCSQITGLIVYYPEGDTTTSKDFKFVDAHGVDVGSGTISLFAANVLVKVVLDIDEGNAYVQNADTNAYLEDKLGDKAPKTHTHNKSEITDFPSEMTPTAHKHSASTVKAGTFAGQVVANASGQAAGVSLLRNSRFSFDENDVPTVEGETVWYLK